MVHQDLQNFIDRPNIEAVEGKSADNEIILLGLAHCPDIGVVEVAPHATGLKVLAAEEATQVSVNRGFNS